MFIYIQALHDVSLHLSHNEIGDEILSTWTQSTLTRTHISEPQTDTSHISQVSTEKDTNLDLIIRKIKEDFNYSCNR